MKNKYMYRALSIIFTLLLVSKTALAIGNNTIINETTYKITSKIFIDGNLVASPQIVALAKQKSSISLSDKKTSLKLTLIAEDIAKENIKVNYDIQYNDGNNTMYVKPVMILIPNQEGIIHIVSDTNHSYDMKVIAERKLN